VRRPNRAVLTRPATLRTAPVREAPVRGIRRLIYHPHDRGLPSMFYFTKIAITLLAIAVIVMMSYRIRGVLLSIFLGLFLAIGLDPIVSKLTQRGMRRGLAALLVSFAILALLTVIILILLQPAIDQTTALVKQLPDFAQGVIDQMSKAGVNFDTNRLSGYIADGVKQLPNILSFSVGGLSKILGTVASSLFNVFTVMVLTVYFMLALPRLRTGIFRLVETQETMDVVDTALSKVGGYVSGQLILCLAAGLTTTIALSLLGVPYPAVIGLVVGVLDALPQVGAMIASVLGALIALSDGWQPMVITLAVILLYQQIENYVISPRVFSSAVGLSPLAVFVAVLIGGGVGGVIGAVVALPVTAAGKVLIGHAMRDRVPVAVDELDDLPGAEAAPGGGSR
jgi:predicted PurR-regulated permease PerM